jgi:hypothetical protein
MKKYLILVPLIAVLTACGSMFSPTDPYAKRAEAEYNRQVDERKQSIKQTPSWYKDKAQTSASAVYAYGVAESKSREDSEFLAKTFAYGKICMSAGGTVSKRGRVYQTGDATISENVIVSACDKTNITGVEISKKEEFVVGNKFQTYVEIVLPKGDANILRTAKDQRKLQETAEKRAPEAFKEIQ